MAYLDITPTETGFETENGDFRLTDRSTDIAANIVLSSYGSYKYAPTIAGRANEYLNSNQPKSVIKRSFMVALKAAGFSKPIIDMSDYPNTIGVNNDQVLEFN